MMSTEEIRKNLMKEMKDLIKEEDNMNIEKVFKCVMDLRESLNNLYKIGAEINFEDNKITIALDDVCIEIYNKNFEIGE